MMEPADLTGFPASPYPAAHVASVPQRSPLRYPGGKTWLSPYVEAWLRQLDPRPALLVEPFGGGGSVSLSALMADWAERALLGELDRDVAAFWQAALRHGPALAEKVRRFQVSRAAVSELADRTPNDMLEWGFRTLVLNRTCRDGILAPGAAFTKASRTSAVSIVCRIAGRVWRASLCWHHVDEYVLDQHIVLATLLQIPIENTKGKRNSGGGLQSCLGAVVPDELFVDSFHDVIER